MLFNQIFQPSKIPQHVLAQPPHIISSFTQEEKKSMPKVFSTKFSLESPKLSFSKCKEASSSKPFLGSMYNEVMTMKINLQTAELFPFLSCSIWRGCNTLQRTWPGWAKWPRRQTRASSFWTPGILTSSWHEEDLQQDFLWALPKWMMHFDQYFLILREEFWRQHTPLYVQKAEQMEKFGLS